MSKLCVIYNMAASYRAPIFQLMDQEFDIDWYYGHQIGDIKEMDSSLLKRVTRTASWRVGPLLWQCGVIGLLRSREYDIYLMLGEPLCMSTWVFCLLKKIFFNRKKIFFWTHGWYGREGFMKKWIKRAFFGLGDGTFTYGNYARDKAIEQGNNPNKIKVIHNSLDHDLHVKMRESLRPSDIFIDHFGNSRPTLIFIGRLTPVKKLHQAIDALAILKARGEYYNLVLVGDGSERKRLKQKALSADLSVWFYGACYDERENAELIYNADLCVSPGNVGLTAIHVMTFGTPVITHDNFPNQMPEFEAVRDGVTGAFFNEDSAESLAESISNWFARPGYSRETVRKNCQDEIDNYWTPGYQLKVLTQHLW